MVPLESNSPPLTFPGISLGLALVSLAATLWPELAHALIYDREALMRGQLWRLFTGHLVHFSTLHLTFNLSVFGIVGTVLELRGHRLVLTLYVTLALGISLGLFWLRPQMVFYGGLSGVAIGLLFFWALAARARRPTSLWPWLVLVGVPIKILWEMGRSTSLLAELAHQPFVPMAASHALGCLGAMAFYLGWRRLHSLGAVREPPTPG